MNTITFDKFINYGDQTKYSSQQIPSNEIHHKKTPEYKMKKSCYTTPSGNIQYTIYQTPSIKSKEIKFVTETPKRKTWSERDSTIFENAFQKLLTLKSRVRLFALNFH